MSQPPCTYKLSSTQILFLPIYNLKSTLIYIKKQQKPNLLSNIHINTNTNPPNYNLNTIQ